MIQDKTSTDIGKILLYVFILMIMLTGQIFAQSSAHYKVKSSVVDQGGDFSQSATYKLNDAVGQSSPVSEAASAHYIISAGFMKGSIVTSVASDETTNYGVPTEFKLSQNYPNPFNPETCIEFQLPFNSEVTLTIYNLQGHIVQHLAHEKKSAGYYSVRWNGRNDGGRLVASGVYFYRIDIKPQDLKQQPFMEIKKMILMK